MANLINWLEIPVENMDRAIKFYEQVLQAQIKIDDQMSPPGIKMGLIHTSNMDMKDVGGALVKGDGYIPGSSNTLIYLNANEIGGCNAFLKRVEQAQGTITSPAFLITPEIGYCGFFTDSEGNRMAVHSMAN